MPKVKKIIQTPKQRTNTLDARDNMLPSIPPENIVRDLWVWRGGSYGYDCKTVACFGGWCAIWPAFVAQGLRAGWGGSPTINGPTCYFNAAEILFGDKGLFLPRRCTSADRGFKGTDHELITHRLNWLLANSKVVA